MSEMYGGWKEEWVPVESSETSWFFMTAPRQSETTITQPIVVNTLLTNENPNTQTQITINVRDEYGRPIMDAYVEVHLGVEDGPLIGKGSTDRAGQFNFNGDPSKRYCWFADNRILGGPYKKITGVVEPSQTQSSGFIPLRLGSEVIPKVVTVGIEPEEKELVILKTTAIGMGTVKVFTISGVTALDKVRINVYKVNALVGSGYTSIAGFFQLNGTDPSTNYTLEAAKTGYVSQRTAFTTDNLGNASLSLNMRIVEEVPLLGTLKQIVTGEEEKKEDTRQITVGLLALLIVFAFVALLWRA